MKNVLFVLMLALLAGCAKHNNRKMENSLSGFEDRAVSSMVPVKIVVRDGYEMRLYKIKGVNRLEYISDGGWAGCTEWLPGTDKIKSYVTEKFYTTHPDLMDMLKVYPVYVVDKKDKKEIQCEHIRNPERAGETGRRTDGGFRRVRKRQ